MSDIILFKNINSTIDGLTIAEVIEFLSKYPNNAVIQLEYGYYDDADYFNIVKKETAKERAERLAQEKAQKEKAALDKKLKQFQKLQEELKAEGLI